MEKALIIATSGKMLKYVAPDKKVKLGLAPIQQFIDDPEHRIIYGDDLRNPGFSATGGIENGQLTGF